MAPSPRRFTRPVLRDGSASASARRPHHVECAGGGSGLRDGHGGGFTSPLPVIAHWSPGNTPVPGRAPTGGRPMRVDPRRRPRGRLRASHRHARRPAWRRALLRRPLLDQGTDARPRPPRYRHGQRRRIGDDRGGARGWPRCTTHCTSAGGPSQPAAARRSASPDSPWAAGSACSVAGTG